MILQCDHISFGYTSSKILFHDVDLSISKGQLITLLGPNGVGKSTLLNCLCGLLHPLQGSIYLDNQPLRQISRKNIARKIAYVPQKMITAFDYSTREYVVMGRTAHIGVIATPSKEDYEKVDHALELMDICHLANRPIGELSGGEQQKACIARAIVQEPELIIMDEPTSALDYGNQIRVIHVIQHLSSLGYAVLMTTHNPDHCFMLGGDVGIIYPNGNFIKGACDTMLTEKSLEEIYNTPFTITTIPEVQRKTCIPHL